jgi:hypothetical protein
VKDFSFVNYDDPNYVLQNPFVKGGLSLENIYCAVTEIHAANWHPMTWLSHMIDCDLYGLNPGDHHLTSIFLHIANVLLLFTILSKATGFYGEADLLQHFSPCIPCMLNRLHGSQNEKMSSLFFSGC